jgi:hypothetical protein
MAANGLSVLVLEKAKKKFSEPKGDDGSKAAMKEASKKVHSAFKGEDSEELGQALGEFFDIYSNQSKD